MARTFLLCYVSALASSSAAVFFTNWYIGAHTPWQLLMLIVLGFSLLVSNLFEAALAFYELRQLRRKYPEAFTKQK